MSFDYHRVEKTESVFIFIFIFLSFQIDIDELSIVHLYLIQLYINILTIYISTRRRDLVDVPHNLCSTTN